MCVSANLLFIMRIFFINLTIYLYNYHAKIVVYLFYQQIQIDRNMTTN